MHLSCLCCRLSHIVTFFVVPSLQEELERLNQASEEINQLELQLDVSFGSRLSFCLFAPAMNTDMYYNRPPPAGCPHRLSPNSHRVRQAPELSGHPARSLHRKGQAVLWSQKTGQGGIICLLYSAQSLLRINISGLVFLATRAENDGWLKITIDMADSTCAAASITAAGISNRSGHLLEWVSKPFLGQNVIACLISSNIPIIRGLFFFLGQ